MGTTPVRYLLALLLLAGLLAACTDQAQPQTGSPIPSPAATVWPGPSPARATDDQSVAVEAWVSYTSPKFGFSLDYPAGWEVVEPPTAAYPDVIDQVWLVSEALPPPQTGARADIVLIFTLEDPTPNWNPEYFNDYQSQAFRLGELPARRITGTNKESELPELVVLAKVGVYYLQALPNMGPASLQYFDPVIASLRFDQSALPRQSPLVPPDPTAGNWEVGFELSGPDMVVQALALDPGGDLYASGEFVTAGGVIATNIARWDGARWYPLGDSLPAPASLLALDSQGRLYTPVLAFNEAGSPVTRLLQWDGSVWKNPGGDLETFIDTVLAGRETNLVITGLEIDAQDRIYAGGHFYISQTDRYVGFVSRWDGAAWSLLGGGMDHTVYSLAVGSDGLVYAGGEFSSAGGTPANRVAQWDGSTWHPLGEGFQDTPSQLALDNDGNLYAAVNGFPTSIVHWDGTTWHTIGSPGGEMTAILSLETAPNGDLYAGGWFTSMDEVPASYIARWDGEAWSALGRGMDREVNALAAGEAGVLYAGGFFSQAGGEQANFLARWDGDAWQALGEASGNGLNLQVTALATDGEGYLYAGGYFTTAGGLSASRVAHWDGVSWGALGSGLNGAVQALALDPAGDLYAAGDFTLAGEAAANRVARWDGANWHPLGTGVDGFSVTALALDQQGRLYAGGDFTTAGSASANHIARWDGVAWQALGEGLDERVNALAVDAQGNLIAGGWFTTAGGVEARGIARWDGTTWSAFGDGLGVVWALAFDSQGQLYAGGDLQLSGKEGGSGIARWDGAAWQVVGGGMQADPSRSSPSVTALAVDSYDRIFAGGGFTQAGEAPANHIAVWDGNTWRALGDGLQGRTNATYFTMVSALVLDGEGSLYAGGDFHTAGGQAAVHFARWVFAD